MLSIKNHQKAIPQLMKLHEGSFDYEQSSWDTFVGWKKQKRRIIKDSKSSKITILMPKFRDGGVVFETNKKGIDVPVIRPCIHSLFHISQTIEGSKVS